MIMSNTNTVAPLSTKSKRKYRLLRTASQTSFTDKCRDTITESTQYDFYETITAEKFVPTSPESSVFAESNNLSSPEDTVNDCKGLDIQHESTSVSLDTLAESLKSSITSDDTFYLSTIITSFSAESALPRGKCLYATCDYSSAQLVQLSPQNTCRVLAMSTNPHTLCNLIE